MLPIDLAPLPGEAEFLSLLRQWHSARGLPFTTPTMQRREMSPWRLWLEVMGQGGYEAVSACAPAGQSILPLSSHALSLLLGCLEVKTLHVFP